MKNFFIKVFLFLCALVALIEGVFFFMVGLRHISIKDAISFYSFLLQTPRAMDIILGFAAGFLCLGLCLLAAALRLRGRQKSILVKENGQILLIPQDAVRSFIDQMLGQNPYLSDFDTTIHSNRKWVYIDIYSLFNSVVPIRQEVSQIRRILRQEIERVFEFTRFKINFQVKGISINREKRYFGSRVVDKELIEDDKPFLEEALNQEADAGHEG